jgi:hypothetical protein
MMAEWFGFDFLKLSVLGVLAVQILNRSSLGRLELVLMESSEPRRRREREFK